MKVFWTASLLVVTITSGAAVVESAPEPDPVVTAGFGVPGERFESLFEPVFQGQIQVYEAGQNHDYSVVLLHGVGEKGMQDFAPVIPVLAEKYHVVAFDLPGFASSEKQNLHYSPVLYAACVKWVVDQRVDGPFAVLGHSLGGAVALRFAATFPRRLDRLILVDVAGVLNRVALSQYMVENTVTGMVGDGPGGLHQALLRTITGLAIDKLENLPIDVEMALGGQQARDVVFSGNPTAIASLALVQEDFSRLLAEIATPTLILWGAEDEVTPLRTARILEARLPNARLELIPEAAHVPMKDRTDAFNRRVLAELMNPPRRPLPPATLPKSFGERVGRCEAESGVVFVGLYDRLEIVRCRKVQMLDVTTRSVAITDSGVVLEGCRIVGDDVALKVQSSAVTATAGLISGRVAISASHSRLDLAGIELQGTEAAVSSPDRSVVIASVTMVDSPYSGPSLHDYFEVTPDSPL